MNWVLPATGYVLLVGGLGVTSKYALRALSWQEVIVWSAIAYAGVAAVLLTTGTPLRWQGGTSGGMAVMSAIVAPVSLALFYIALTHGAANRVVPFTSTYPLITVMLTVLFLSEQLTAARVIGAVLVVVGVGALTS